MGYTVELNSPMYHYNIINFLTRIINNWWTGGAYIIINFESNFCPKVLWVWLIYMKDAKIQ